MEKLESMGQKQEKALENQRRRRSVRKDKGEDQQATWRGRGGVSGVMSGLKLSPFRSLPRVREAAENDLLFTDQPRRAAEEHPPPPTPHFYQPRVACNLGNH